MPQYLNIFIHTVLQFGFT